MEVGMYARYKDYIAKITEIKYAEDKEEDNYICFDCFENCFESEIKKASNNVIDLIEVGDFIEYKQSNFYWNIPTRVSGKYNRQQELTELMVGEIPLKKVEVTSIVTKEIFNAMKYEVEEC